MQIAVRSHLTAGLAALGAGIIVASPIVPSVPELHLPSIHSSAMNLAAAVTPIDAYAQVLKDAVTNFQTLTADGVPAPILKQILANQTSSFTALGGALQTAGGGLASALTTQVPALLQVAFDHLGAGDITGALNALLTVPLALTQPAVNLLPAIVQTLIQPVQNLVNVVKVFSDPLNDSLFAVGLLGPVITGLGATGVVVQNVVDAVVKGDLQQVGNAILTAPAVIADGVLNGGYGPDLGSLVGGGFAVFAGGLLTPGGFEFTPDGNVVLNVAGPVATLQQLAKSIAAALKPATALTTQSVRTQVAAVPAPAATADTLTAGGQQAHSPARPGSVATRAPEQSAGESRTHATAPAVQSGSAATEKADGHGATKASSGGTKTAASAGTGRTDRRAAGAHSGK
jgi:hypothetical protein